MTIRPASCWTADSYYLDGSVRRLEATIRVIGGRADFTYVPGATHSMAEIYAQHADRSALWNRMTRAMYAVARTPREKAYLRRQEQNPLTTEWQWPNYV